MKEFEQYSDWEVVQKILAGEVALFEIIIRRNNPFLYKTGRSYNYNHEDTRDLMQDTYLDAFTGLAQFQNRSSFKTWIIKIMLRNCYRKQQKWNFKNIHPAEISETSVPVFSNHQLVDTTQTVMNRELSTVIEKALQQIPLDYRMVFTLREMNGLNVAETADALATTEANVKVRLNRAKTMLRKEVEKSYSTEDIFEFNLVYCDAMIKDVMTKIKQLHQQKS